MLYSPLSYGDNLHYEKFADGSVKCIEDEIPFDLPDGWAWAKINTIAFVTKLAGFEYTKNIAPGLCEDGIPLFKGICVGSIHPDRAVNQRECSGARHWRRQYPFRVAPSDLGD